MSGNGDEKGWLRVARVAVGFDLTVWIQDVTRCQLRRSTNSFVTADNET